MSRCSQCAHETPQTCPGQAGTATAGGEANVHLSRRSWPPESTAKNAARLTHNAEVAGSNPAPASTAIEAPDQHGQGPSRCRPPDVVCAHPCRAGSARGLEMAKRCFVLLSSEPVGARPSVATAGGCRSPPAVRAVRFGYGMVTRGLRRGATGETRRHPEDPSLLLEGAARGHMRRARSARLPGRREAPWAYLGHEAGDNKGQQRCPAGSRDLALTSRRRLGAAAFARAYRVWHARGQGFEPLI